MAASRGYEDPEVEDCVAEAVAVAREQGAKAFELRALTSLARLPQTGEKVSAAHQALSEICDWFSEGLESRDLRTARAVLARPARR